MPLTKEKLKSFVELCKTEKVAKVLLIEQYPDFVESDYTNAYEYFVSKGMIQTDPIDDITICGWIAEQFTHVHDLKSLIGGVMKRSGGKCNPNRVKDLIIKMNIGVDHE